MGKNTKRKLLESFKSILQRKDFQMIKIKDITDEAGVFRSTFYHYFPDKYALFDAVLDDELFYIVRGLTENGMYKQALELIFRYFYDNKDFYQRAFQSSGQDSCEEYLKKHLCQFAQSVLGDLTSQQKTEISGNFKNDIVLLYLTELFYMSLRFFLDLEVEEHDDLLTDIDRFIQMLCYGFLSFIKTESPIPKQTDSVN